MRDFDPQAAPRDQRLDSVQELAGVCAVGEDPPAPSQSSAGQAGEGAPKVVRPVAHPGVGGPISASVTVAIGCPAM